MKKLLIFLSAIYSVAQAQPVSDTAKGVIMYDNAEADPKASWGTPKTKGWNYFSGGDHNPANQNQTATVRRVPAGYEGAPAARFGNSSYRLRVIKDNTYPACCNYVRSEMYWGGGNGNEYTGVNWQAVSIFIPADWCDDNRPIGIAFDNKFANAQGPASFYLKIENGQFQVNRQWPQGGAEYRTNVGPVVKGRWIDLVLHRNYKDDNTGYMEFFMDKKMVWSHYGPNYVMEAGSQTEGYVLQGIYKWSWSSANGQGEGSGLCNTQYTIYMDEFKFGNAKATLESMSPGGSAPPPDPIPAPTLNPKFVNSACAAVACPAVPIPDKSITKTTDSILIYATHTNTSNSNHIKSFSARQLKGPNAALLSFYNQTGYIPTQVGMGFRGLVSGTYTFAVTVTDMLGLTATDTFDLKVNSLIPINRPPVVSAGPDQTVSADSAVINPTMSDPDGDALVGSWTVLAGTGTVSGKVVKGLSPGVNTFRITATDPAGLSGSDEVAITYNPPPPPQTIFIRDVKVEQRFIEAALRVVVIITFLDGTTLTVQSK